MKGNIDGKVGLSGSDIYARESVKGSQEFVKKGVMDISKSSRHP